MTGFRMEKRRGAPYEFPPPADPGCRNAANAAARHVS